MTDTLADIRRSYPRVLSAEHNHELAIGDESLRGWACLVSDLEAKRALLLYSQPHMLRGDSHFVEFMARLAKAGLAYERRPVAISLINELYSATRSEAEAKKGIVQGDQHERIGRFVTIAQDRGSSDIRFVIRRGFCQIRIKVNGDSLLLDELRGEEGDRLSRSLYGTLTEGKDGNDWNPRVHQKAAVKPEVARLWGLDGARIMSSPLGLNERLITMRLQAPPKAGAFSLEQLGYLPEQVRLIRKMISKRRGLVLITGPVNQGKSTTQYAALEELLAQDNHTRDLLAIEDPIERRFSSPSAYQIQVHNDDWESPQAAILRHAPDYVMPGEIRDARSAHSAISLGLAGNFTWPTLHVFELMGIPHRLVELGVEPALAYDSLLMSGFVFQHLVPTLCPECMLKGAGESLDADLRDRLWACGVDPRTVNLRKPDGCYECYGMGRAGRTAATEVCLPTHDTMAILRKDGIRAARHQWIHAEGGITKVEHLLHHIRSGTVDPRDAEGIIELVLERPLSLTKTISEAA